MAKLWIALVAALLAVAVFVAVRAGGDPPQAPGRDPAARQTEDPHAPPPSTAARRQELSPPVDPTPETGSDGEPQPTPPPTLPGEPGRCVLQLRVFDVTTREPVSAFQYDWRQAGAHDQRGVEGHRADVPVTPGAEGELLVEAEGYQPERRTLTVPTGLPAMEVELQLAPAAREMGIELTVRDSLARPVPHVRVDAWKQLQPGPPRVKPSERPQGPPQWARRAHEPLGVYRLPDLEPGHWLVRVQALSEEGTPTTLRPDLRRFSFGGSEHLPLLIEMAQGSLVTLTVVDASGRALGGQVGLRLRRGEETDEVGVDWLATIDGQSVRRRGGLPGAAPATLVEAVAPGRYSLDLFWEGEPQQTVELWLSPGQHHQERVVLPSRR